MKNLNLLNRLLSYSHEKQTPQRFGRYAAMLLLLLTCVTLAWATPTEGDWCAASGAHVYFDNTNSSYTNVSILIGRQWDWGGDANPVGSWGENFSLVSGTNNLYYKSISQDHYTTFCFINATNWGWETNTVTARLRWCTNTDTPNDNLGSGTHLYVPASGSDNASVTHTTPASYTALNYTQTLNQKLSTDGGSTFSTSTASIATVTVSSNKLNGNNSTTSDSGEIGTGESSTSCLAARTATVTYEVDDVATGYTFVGWYDGDTQKSTNTTYTYTATGAKTITARFKETQYSLTFSHNGHGSIAVAGNTVSSGSTANVNYFTTMTLVATPSTGYNFSGWTKSGSNTGSVTIGNAANASTTIKATNTGATVTAGFTAKTYTITLDDNGSYDGDGSATATYNSSTLSFSSHASRTDYRVDGYYAEAGLTTKVINADGTLVANVTNYTGAGGIWTRDADTKLYAKWVYDVTEYKVTFGVGTSYTSLGSLSAYDNTASSSISSGSDVRSGHSVTFTASPNTGYTVEGWYTDASCTLGKHDAGSLTYTASISAATNVYVKFEEKTWSVAFAAGTGDSVTTPAATPQTVGQLTGISIAATPSTGYTFNTWTITSGSGSFTSSASTNSNTFKPTAASTVTASFNETMSSLSTSCHYDAGTPGYAAPTVSNSATTIGYGTTRTITAAAAGTGYTFAGWTITNGVRTDGGGATANPITVRSDGTGSAVTVTANYNEVLTTSWYIAGDAPGTTAGSPFAGWGTSGTAMKKKTGHSTEEIYYCNITVSTVATTDDHFPFKVYNSASSGTYYGNNGYWVTKENNSPTLTSSEGGGSNMKFRPYVTGTYEFKVDNTGASPVLTVTWPVFNQVRISSASPADATNVGNFDLGSPVSNVRTVTRSLNANTTYTFKIMFNSDWYGYNSGTFTRETSTSSNSRTISDEGGNMTLTTDYGGSYTFKFNESTKALSVDFPTAYKVTYGKGSVDGSASTCSAVDIDNSRASVTSNSTWVLSGHKVELTAPTEKTGFAWDGWFDNNAGDGDAISTNKVCTLTVNSAKTAYACYHEIPRTITVTAGTGGSVATGSVTAYYQTKTDLPAATADPGYYFTGWTTTTGTLSYDNQGSATTAKVYGMTAACTVQANFAPIWRIACSNDSHNTENHKITNITTSAGAMTSGYVDITLAANTDYNFKVYNKSTAHMWGKTSTVTKITYLNQATAVTLSDNTGNYQTFLTAGAGTYRFTWDVTNSRVTITYPTSYTVTFGQGTGNGTAVTATVEDAAAITSGQYAAEGKDVTFSQEAATGYTFKGWYDAADGGSAIEGMGTSDHVLDDIAADATVYAQYTANTYAVTFNVNGGKKLTGDLTNNATFDQATISYPTVKKDGYCFDGWFSASSDGVKVIDAEGSLQPNVSVSATTWTDGDGKWKKLGTATVYAQYSIPDTIMLDPNPETLNAFAAEHSGKDTLVVSPRFNCTPTGDWNISYLVGYSENKTLLEPQPTIIYGTGAGVGHDTIRMPAAANTYMIISILRTGSTRGEGTEVTRDTLNYVVEDLYTVKARRIVDGVDIEDAATWSGYPTSRPTTVNAPLEVNGYVLDHWELGVGIDTVDGVGTRTATYETKQIYAHNNGTVKLHYKPKPNTVYFMDGFDMYWYSTHMKMYDYGTSTGYWNDGYGADSHDNKTGDTVKVASHGTPEVMMMAIGSSSTNFAITNERMDNYGHFHGLAEGNQWARVIYRTDFNGATSMFVPVSKEPRPIAGSDFYVLNQTEADPSQDISAGAAHYYRGFWVKYSPNRDSTGYYLHVYDKVDQATANTIQTLPLRLTQTGEGNTWELTAKMDLEAGKTYGFKITKATGASTKTWYSNSGTMDSGNHTGWVLDGTTNNIGLKTTSAGDYTFHIFCKDFGTKAANVATDTHVQGQLAVTVDYAAVSGDYRVIYSDATQTEVIASPSIHPRENGQDTVSFFIRKNETSRVMKIQKFTSDWADFGDPIDLSAEPFSIAKDSVYVIYLQQNEDGSSISATGCGFYDGDFYIRTDCVDEHKWDYKQSLDNHRMIPSDYGLTSVQPVKFSHYYVHWIDEGGNVKFVVANKYAPCVSDTLITDTYANVAGGNLPSDGDAGTNIGASIRFMYNKGTNEVNRAYLAGAQGGAYDPNYLKLSTSTDSMGTTAATPVVIRTITFTDLKNFVYQAEIKAKPGLTANLTAKYNNNTQYFRGSDKEDEEILGGTTTEWQSLLLTYDFKVNRLICAWQPDGDSINGNVPINADIMVIRTGQNDAQQIIFKNNDSKLSDVKYIYSVMQFNYDDMVGHMYTWGYTAYQYCMYYISFPYDVLVNDIMAPGAMGSAWRLQRYNGAERAKGWFAGDGVSTFWEDVQSGDTLHAYEGYSLLLNRRLFNDGSSSVWLNKGAGSKLYMYFPSKDATVGVVANKTVNVTVPSHECTVDRIFEQDLGKPAGSQRNHKIVDSHWNMIGTPLFEDQTASTITAGPSIEGAPEPLQYIYAWNPAGNTLGIKNTLTTGFEFKTMYGYMAQYAGTITFIGAAVNKVVAANRNVEKKNYTMNLELTNGDDFIGRTYVELRENAVDSFLLNEDVYMVKNGVSADLYTFAGAYEAGANVLTIDNHIVPVGIDVNAAGTYTFSMPDNFDGEVILVDNYTQTRTNLMIEDYEIALPTGTITDRFYIEININKTPTAIDGVDGGSFKDGKAHKFIMNDQMYILKDGEMFDARGNRVQ